MLVLQTCRYSSMSDVRNGTERPLRAEPPEVRDMCSEGGKTSDVWPGFRLPCYRHPPTQPFLFRFGRVTCHAFAIASVALALLVTQGIPPLRQQPPVLLFFAAVILTSWYGGRAAGFMASILSMLALDFFFIEPIYSLWPLEIVEDGSDFVAFATASLARDYPANRWRKSHYKLVAMERDMETARQIQQRLFPPGPPTLAGFEVGGACFPAEATGGDFFDYIVMPDGCLGIVCGDVSGHGIGPALLMVLVHSYLRALAHALVDPAEILTKANGLVHDDIEDDRFITLFFARLDRAPVLSSMPARHEAHLIDACGKVTTLSSTGLPLGILEAGEISQGPSIILDTEQIFCCSVTGYSKRDRPVASSSVWLAFSKL